MTGLRVSELAARAGVNASAVRFYERAGLLPAARRGANGYRVFEDSALDDLALIAQAKGLGMTLEGITTLLAAWHGSSGGTCQDAHALLCEHLTEQETRLNHEIAELSVSRQQSQAASARLAAHPPDHESCHAGCACAEALEPAPPGNAENRPAGCTLDDDELACRVGEWRALAAAALSAERDGGSLNLALEPAMLPAAAALIAAEATCCPDARFTLTVAAGRASLRAEFPA